VGTLRFWARRHEAASPPASYEPTPYCDRLTLAEPFSEDSETRAKAEDRRAERVRVIEAATESISARPRR
jgi:hypothetical protein